MADSEKYKVIVVETDLDLRAGIEKLLLAQNYEPACFESSSAAFSELESSESSPYAVAIVSYKMPKMKGDEVLTQIKELSPDTSRIIYSDVSSIDIIVKAINNAEINSCLCLPFKDEDFISQVNSACQQFQEIEKKQNLQRTIQRQNKQLYHIAKQLKEKSVKNIAKIEEKEKKIRLLSAEAKHDDRQVEPLSLKSLIKEKNIELTAERFGKEFIIFKDQIKEILEKAAGGSIGLDDVVYEEIGDNTFKKDDPPKGTDKILHASFEVLKQTAFLGVAAIDAVQGNNAESGDFELTIPVDKSKALLKLKTFGAQVPNAIQVKEFLEEKGVRFGIKDDKYIESWLTDASPSDDAVIIAKGRKSKQPVSAEIKYHFPIEFRQPGKVDKDGRIDFKERGDIPFVEKDTFLAAKVFPEPGVAGMDVFGEAIPVDEPIDMAFGAGNGARQSDDGVKIYADIDGTPSLDPLGIISVSPELKIDGDVGFETGNVEFEGNVIVKGIVKEGFNVKCASLTVEQIEGAEIDIIGDLNVSSGIVDANLIKVKGNIQAKYINNSKVYGFGDLVVQKEILDSEIRLSGACVNTGGTIIASDISAKMGIDGGNIGTQGSRPSKLKVGVDEHTNFLVAKIDSRLKVNIDTITVLRNEISKLDEEDQKLHVAISEHAYTQDRTQVKLKDVEKKKFDLQASGNAAALQKVYELEEQMNEQAKEAEDEINEGFERQDEVAQEMSQKQERIKQFEEINQELLEEKKKLQEFSAKKAPLAEVKAANKVMSGTKISGPGAFVTIREATSKCRIMEISQHDESTGTLGYSEMVITDL